MNKNFIVADIDRWIRIGKNDRGFMWEVTHESRPHVIPITPEAIQAMENYIATKQRVCSGPFGNFVDAISNVVYDNAVRLAFRFVTMTEEDKTKALELAEEWLTKQPSKPIAANQLRDNCFSDVPGIPSRLDMIGEIRDMLPQLYEQGRFELGKEIMGGIHQDDFTGVTDKVVRQIWTELKNALKSE